MFPDSSLPLRRYSDLFYISSRKTLRVPRKPISAQQKFPRVLVVPVAVAAKRTTLGERIFEITSRRTTAVSLLILGKHTLYGYEQSRCLQNCCPETSIVKLLLDAILRACYITVKKRVLLDDNFAERWGYYCRNNAGFTYERHDVKAARVCAQTGLYARVRG